MEGKIVGRIGLSLILIFLNDIQLYVKLVNKYIVYVFICYNVIQLFGINIEYILFFCFGVFIICRIVS